MKAYYIASQENFAQHIESYRHTFDALVKAHVTLLNDDWMTDYSAQPEPETSSKYYNKAMKQIADSDVVIFDATVSSMGVGHQMTYALYLQKPTLLLLDANFKQPENLFIAGSKSPFLTICTYSGVKDIDETIARFISKNRFSKKGRLNLALDQRQQEYLQWGAYYYNISKTDMVKRAIDAMIDQDKHYKSM